MICITINGIEVFIEESEKYVQTNDIAGSDLPAMWETLRNRFPGYELTLCYHNMEPPIDALTSIGAAVLEDCLEMNVTQPDFKPYENINVNPLEKTAFEEFSSLHSTVNPECGVTSQLIWNKWDKHPVFTLYKDSGIIGYSIISLNMRDETIGEIYAVYADNQENRKALLSAVTACAFENNKTQVIYMVDRGNADDYETATALGYKEVGYYIGYHVKNI